MVDMSSLADLPEGKVWSPLTPESLSGPALSVFAFDQSLTATGVVMLHRRVSGSIRLLRSDTIRTKVEDRDGFEKDFEQARLIEQGAREILASLAVSGDAVVHETPLVPNAALIKKMGPRVGVASRMAAQAVRSAANRLNLQVTMVQSQQSKKLVCGNAKADKKEAHRALATLAWIEGLEKATNEHERDAILLGLNVLSKTRG